MSDSLELAYRAVECKHWRWMPGMLTTTRMRVIRVDDDGNADGFHDQACYLWVIKDALPDLEDPATLGCLLELVRRAWHNPRADVLPYTSLPYAAALVAALEAAP